MKRVTNGQLRELLGELGFESRESVEPKCLVLEHPVSKARVLLPSNKDNEDARSADIISIRIHLLYRGHLSQEAFEHFVDHGQLRAS